MNTKYDVFGFNTIQNFRTLAIMERRDGVETVEAMLVRLDNYIAEKHKEMRLGIVQPPPTATENISIKEMRKQVKQQRFAEKIEHKSKIEKLRESTPCTNCGNGRVIIEKRDGVYISICVSPKMSGNRLLFLSGCGWSEMVK